MEDHASRPKPFLQGLALSSCEWGEIVFITSQETMGILLVLLFLLGQDFYNGVATYFNVENKKVRELKRYIIVIDDFEIEIVHFFGKNQKLHCLVLDTI